MSRKRRPKSTTNPTDMSTDQPAEDSAIPEVEAAVAEPAVEAADEPVTVEEPAEEAPAPPSNKPTAVLVDVLLGVFTKRTIDAIDPALWEQAVNAVKQGQLVVLRGYAPHIEITADEFDPQGKLPAGVSSSTSVLNNLLAGML